MVLNTPLGTLATENEMLLKEKKMQQPSELKQSVFTHLFAHNLLTELVSTKVNVDHLGYSIQKWIRSNLWKTAFKGI